LLILLAFVTSFDIPQNQNVEKKTNSDSLTVNLKFQNPNLVLKDYRNYELLNRLIETNQDSDNEIAQAINNVTGVLPYIVENQERRYESAMDFLERRTEYKSQEIEKFIRQHRLSQIISTVVIMTYCMMWFTGLTVDKRVPIGTFIKHFLVRVILGFVIYLAVHVLFKYIIWYDGYRFYALLSLSG